MEDSPDVVVQTLQHAPGTPDKLFPLAFFSALFLSEQCYAVQCGDPLGVKVDLERVKDFLSKFGTPTSGYKFFGDLNTLPPGKTKLYPPDVDDTAVLLEAQHLSGMLTGSDFKKGVSLLKQNLSDGGQSFFVWFPDDNNERKSDIRDPIVDLNVWKCLAHDTEMTAQARNHIFNACSDLTQILSSPYYSHPSFNLWLALRSCRALHPDQQQEILCKNRGFLQLFVDIKHPDGFDLLFNDIEPSRHLDALMFLVKGAFEREPLIRHTGHETEYSYPGPYVNMFAHLIRPEVLAQILSEERWQALSQTKNPPWL